MYRAAACPKIWQQGACMEASRQQGYFTGYLSRERLLQACCWRPHGHAQPAIVQSGQYSYEFRTSGAQVLKYRPCTHVFRCSVVVLISIGFPCRRLCILTSAGHPPAAHSARGDSACALLEGKKRRAAGQGGSTPVMPACASRKRRHAAGSCDAHARKAPCIACAHSAEGARWRPGGGQHKQPTWPARTW